MADATLELENAIPEMPDMSMEGENSFSYPLENQRLEPENHLFEKENHLNQTSIFGFHVNVPRV